MVVHTHFEEKTIQIPRVTHIVKAISALDICLSAALYTEHMTFRTDKHIRMRPPNMFAIHEITVVDVEQSQECLQLMYRIKNWHARVRVCFILLESIYL